MAWAALLTWVLVGAGPLWARAAAVEISAPALDGVYTDLADELDPIQQGLVVLRLSSPSNRLVLVRNSLRLTPLPEGGGYAAELDLVVEGEAQIVGTVELGALSAPLADEVMMPRQRFVLPGAVRLGRAEGGVAVTVLEIPRAVEVAVETGLGGRLVELCEGFAAALPFVVDCSGLAGSVGTLVIDLPPAGETYVVPFSQLPPEARPLLESLLGE